MVPAVIQVGLEGVEFGWPALPLPVERFLRGGCVGEELDGAGGHAELAADRPPAEPSGQQFVDGRVVDAGAVGEAVSLGQGEPEGSSNFSGPGAGWVGSGARTCRHPRWSATHRSAASLRLCQRCHLSATYTACGAPAVAPSAKNGARPRQTTSTPGRCSSQAARPDASLSGSRSTGRRLSTSTRTVP